jgi:hypothetical protein
MNSRRFLTGVLLMVIAGAGQARGSADLWNLVKQHPEFDQHNLIVVDISSQSLQWFLDGELEKRYHISTSRYGIGSRAGSNKTPLGLHYVKRKIGADATSGTIFKGRVSTGRVARIEHRPLATGDDFVTSRILWLSGLEEGRNRGNGVDSFSRYIYIHGTHEEGLIGKPASHGCIRMFNRDVIDLYKRIHTRTLVWIQE